MFVKMNFLIVTGLAMCIVACTAKSVSSHDNSGNDIYKRLMSDLSELYSSSSEKRQSPRNNFRLQFPHRGDSKVKKELLNELKSLLKDTTREMYKDAETDRKSNEPHGLYWKKEQPSHGGLLWKKNKESGPSEKRQSPRNNFRLQFPHRGDNKVKKELLDELKSLLEDTTREMYKDAETERRSNEPHGLYWKKEQPSHGALLWKKNKESGPSGINWKKNAAQPPEGNGLTWSKKDGQPVGNGLVWKKDNGPPGSGLFWQKKDLQPPQGQENGLIWRNKQANRGMKDERRELFGQIKDLLSKTLQKMDEMDGTKKEISNDIQKEGDKKEEILSELKSLLSDEKKQINKVNDAEGELKTVLHDTLSNFEKEDERPKPRENVYKRLVNDLNGLFDKRDETASGKKMSTLNDDLAELVQSTKH